jgi:GNAT superfamily N-acetyltransferase
MIIHDNHGGRHELLIGKTITLDTYSVGTWRQSDSKAIMHGFSLPPALQGLGIGSAILKHLEQELHKRHVNTFSVIIPFADCPVHESFWKKHGYSQNKNEFTRHW